MKLKEYRICMPMTLEEFQIGQVYTIARSTFGQGIEILKSEPCEDPVHGKGHYTEKKIHLSARLPSFIRNFTPSNFYAISKSWDYLSYTLTEYTTPLINKFSARIETRNEENAGTTENVMNLSEKEIAQRQVDLIDIATEKVSEAKYKEDEDPTKFQSSKTKRGPLSEGWRDNTSPMICSYKVLRVNYDVWMLQGKVEAHVASQLRDFILLAHRQTFAWMDEWYGMTMEEVRAYEKEMKEKTNEKIRESN